MDAIKVSILEKEGTELDRSTEYDLHAGTLPFSSPLLEADNAKDAILEANNVANLARFMDKLSYNGQAGSGKYLESSFAISSNDVGIIMSTPSTMKAFSVGTKQNDTGTITIYKKDVNGSITTLDTISLSGSRKSNKKNLTYLLAELDEIFAQVTSGSFTSPVLSFTFQNTG